MLLALSAGCKVGFRNLMSNLEKGVQSVFLLEKCVQRTAKNSKHDCGRVTHGQPLIFGTPNHNITYFSGEMVRVEKIIYLSYPHINFSKLKKIAQKCLKTLKVTF